MALRLQDSEEDKTAFVRSLKGPYRAFWFWLKRACNHAGVWEIDLDEARMRTGFFELDQADAEAFFSSKIVKLSCGEKWFLIDFAAEQLKTRELNFKNTYHRGVIKIFDQLGIFELNYYKLTEQKQIETKPLQSSLQATKDKEIDKDMFIDKEIDNTIELEVKTNIVPKIEKEPKEKKEISEASTFVTPLVQAFREFKEMRQRKRAPLTPRAAELIHMELKKLAGDNDELKILILQQSVRRSWSDVFPLRPDSIQQSTDKPAAPAATRTPRKTA